ncbi:hypothetical protein SORDD16_00414 [Streptococcus oralis]|uniref:HAD family phosphatase n=1 Tax=Streptococcus oralis TaxID=1303 RepID=A0A139PFI7_STROR|nr:hypothetical protein SORDD16_00414 [Streptococcus oralis]
MMKINTIVFDMGNVLIEWDSDKVVAFFESDFDRQAQL